MAHSVFTIVNDVDPQHIGRLNEVLARMQQAIQGVAHDGPRIRFENFTQLHFACLVVFDRDGQDPVLVFENSVDGSIGDYLRALLERAAPGIDAVYENCKGFPVGGTTAEKRRYLKESVRRPHVYHVGAAYRHARYIREDAALRDRLDARVDELMEELPPDPAMLPAPPRAKRFPSWTWLAVALAAPIVLTALYPASVIPRIAWMAAVFVAALHVRSRRRNRARRLGQQALLGASPETEPAAAWIWERLRDHCSLNRYSEPRTLDRLTNWLFALSPLLVATVLLRYVGDHPVFVVAVFATLFALEALWLLVLVGWPKGGEWGRKWFPLIAALGGAFLGAWPACRPLSAWTALALLGGLGLASVARALRARQARKTHGNWRIIPFVLLAAGVGALAVVALGTLWTAGIGRFVPNPPWLVTLLAKGAVAALAALFAFLGLVLVSVTPGPLPRIAEVRSWLAVLLAGAFAGLFWLASGPAPVSWFSWPGWFETTRPWLASGVLALLTFVSLLALWGVPLPSPEQSFEPPTREKLRLLTADEDRCVQNHMATMVRVRDDWRAPLLKFFLRTLNRLFYRTLLPDLRHGTLFGITTVHFAQWTVLDRRHHIFLSNYDLSWTAYLDDFGAQLASGIQKIWGQSEGNPGVSNVDAFKEFVRTQMVRHGVWYSAYPDLTVQRIRNNESIRLALLHDERA